jgi:hypothetical protein
MNNERAALTGSLLLGSLTRLAMIRFLRPLGGFFEASSIGELRRVLMDSLDELERSGKQEVGPDFILLVAERVAPEIVARKVASHWKLGAQVGLAAPALIWLATCGMLLIASVL